MRYLILFAFLLTFVSTSSAFWTSDNLVLLSYNIKSRGNKTLIECSIENTHETDSSFRTAIVVSFRKDDLVVFMVNHMLPDEKYIYTGAGQVQDFSLIADIDDDEYDTYDIIIVGSFTNDPPGGVSKSAVKGEMTIDKPKVTIVEWSNCSGARFVTVYGEVTNNTNASVTNVITNVGFSDTDGNLISVAIANQESNPLLGTLINPGESVPFAATVHTFGTIGSWGTRAGFNPIRIVGFAEESSDDSDQEQEDDSGEVPAAVMAISWGQLKSSF